MRRCLLVLCLLVSAGTPALAQDPVADAASTQPPDRAASPERELNLITLPTTHSLKRHGSYFRLTHRFTRDLRLGSFGNLIEDLFGLDAGAIIGLEYRFAPTADLQLAVHRTNLFKDIQLSGRYDAWREGERPVGLSLVGSVEGDNNFQDHHQPAAGLVLSRGVAAGRILLYTSPLIVWNTPTELTGHEDHDHEHPEGLEPPAADEEPSDYTAFIGLGARVRLLESVFVSGEYSPRLSGYRPDRGVWGVALEKYTRGHMFQINFTNSFATTFGQIARGGDGHNVYLGFNLARTF